MNSGRPKNSWARAMGKRAAPPQQDPESQFGALRASLLFCPKCRQATPAQERLLLVLPTGNLHEYFCAQCGTTTGSRTDNDQNDAPIIVP